MDVEKLLSGNKSGPAFVLAEIACAHEGSVAIMKKMIEAAKNADVDAVKIQIFMADQLVTHDHPQSGLYRKLELTREEWSEVFGFAKSMKMQVLADVFDNESLNIAEENGVISYKVHSTIISDAGLLRDISRTSKPILLSTGGSTQEEVEDALAIIRKEGNDNVIMICGYQGFPTKIEESHLNMIPALHEKFGLPVGYADHCDAEDSMAVILPMVAVSMGACLIEKHITLDRSQKGIDYYSSLNPDELKTFTAKVREVEMAFGKGEFQKFSKEEEEYRKGMKKYIVAGRSISKGKTIEENDIAFKRTTSPGLQSNLTARVIGKKATEDIEKDVVIKESMVN